MCEEKSWNKIRELTGENPHQKGAVYQAPHVPACSLLNAERLWGGELNYNDFLDTDAALALMREFADSKDAVTVFYHHGNPCAVALAENQECAYLKAKDNCDMTSVIEGILVINGTLDAVIAQEICKLYLHVAVAPAVTKEALELLKTQPQLTVFAHPDMMVPVEESLKEIRSFVGGVMVQDYNTALTETMESITSAVPDEETMGQLILAWKVVKHVKTNAIVLVRDDATVGIGPGLNNRIWSTQQAIERAGEKAKNSVLASDAIIPLWESIDIAGQAGIKAIIEPGGWYKEDENIAVAEKYGIAMVTTGVNQFKH